MQCQEEALSIVHSTETCFKRPGLSLLPISYYESLHGDLEHNGKKQQGHYTTVDDQGNEVIAIPDAPITRVEFNSRRSVQRRSDMGMSADDIDPSFPVKRQVAMADAMVPGMSGHHTKTNAFDELLRMPNSKSSSTALATSSAAPCAGAPPPMPVSAGV